MTERFLEGRSALVTGSTSGIGLGIAELYAKAGAKVMLNGFGKPEDIAEARAEVGQAMGGGDAPYSGADLSKPEQVRQMVKDAEKAAKIYGTAFGAEISDAVPLPEHGVITVFATLPNTKIEFIQPLGEDSPIAKFVERNPDGGIHHVCYEVPEIIAARDKLIAEGARVLGDGNPKIGAHGKPVLFLHPKDFSGALVEIEQS